MKKWLRADEWMGYGLCWGDPRFTADRPTDHELVAVQQICDACPVRIECAEWALQNKATGVVAAGIHLPDPGEEADSHVHAAARRSAYSELRKQIRTERTAQ